MANETRSLSEERASEITSAIVDYFIRQNFSLTPNNADFRKTLGDFARKFGHGVTTDELQSYLEQRLPRMLSDMFGYGGCGITFRRPQP